MDIEQINIIIDEIKEYIKFTKRKLKQQDLTKEHIEYWTYNLKYWRYKLKHWRKELKIKIQELENERTNK